MPAGAARRRGTVGRITSSALTFTPWIPTPPATNKWISHDGTGSGNSVIDPMSLDDAIATADPGDVFGVMNTGTYSLLNNRLIIRGGSSGQPVVFRAADMNDPPLLRYDGVITLGLPAATWNYVFQVDNGVNYVDFYGLHLQGNGGGGAATTWAMAGIHTGVGWVNHANHHIGVYGCRVWNMGAAGISTAEMDYFYCIGNQVWHCGYNTGEAFSSGISLWRAWWFDAYTGFHSVIKNNVVSGCYDAQVHTDGNGIILDLQDDDTVGTPWVLVADNVVFGNGGMGIQNTKSQHAYIINNLGFKDGRDIGIDPADDFPYFENWGGLVINQVPSGRGHWFNNIMVMDTAPILPTNPSVGRTELRYCYYVDAVAQDTMAIKKNAAFGGTLGGPQTFGNTVTSAMVANLGDPLFTGPPTIGTADAASLTVSPWSLADDAWVPQGSSPLLAAGFDPRTHADVNANQIADMNTWLLTDYAGHARGADWDIGPFQILDPGSSPSPSVPDAPTGLHASPAPGEVEIAFVAGSNNGSAIDLYRVTTNPGSITTTGSASPITVTPLTDGVTYTFTVAAHNALGWGPESASITAVPGTEAIFSSGFENTDPTTEGWLGNGATISRVVGAAARTGAHGWRLNSGDQGFAIYKAGLGFSLGNDVRARLYFYLDNTRTLPIRLIGFRQSNSVTRICGVNIKADNNLEVVGPVATLFTGTTPLSNGVWYRIELQAIVAAAPTGTNGSMDVRIDGTSVYGPVTNIGIGLGAISQLLFGELNGGATPIGAATYYDDVAVTRNGWPDP